MVDLGLSGGTSGSVVVRAIPSEPAVHTPLTVVCVLSELRGAGGLHVVGSLISASVISDRRATCSGAGGVAVFGRRANTAGERGVDPLLVGRKRC